VLLDWRMPGLDGIETARRIRERADPPKVILVTAHGREEVLRRAAEVGLSSFLIKPISRSTLFDTIIQLFGHEGTGASRRRTTFAPDRSMLAPIQGARILLVEDNEVNQQVAQELLEHAGFVVEVAADGREAIEAATSEAFDLVLMDIQMPEVDGLEATRRIKAMAEERDDARLRDLPIVAMTAHAMAGDREKSLEAGMVDHVNKPVDPEKLFAALARWIEPGERETPTVTLDREVAALLAPVPEIDGVDTEEGLARVGGNDAAYRKILRSFGRGQSEVVAEIRAALDEDDLETARRHAHTVKGAGGNIGAGALSEAAAALETSLKSEECDEALLETFEREMERVLDGLAQVLAEDEPTVTVGEAREADPVAVAPFLREIAGLVESDLTEAQERVEALAEHLAGTPLAGDQAELADRLDGFDTDGALETLRRMAAALEIDLE
jgi:CheY-like chemotaxis protein/HPt (histidine-containing phosphotransfer) domain-containing protein